MMLVENLSQWVTEKNEAPEKVFADWTVRVGESSAILIFRDNGEVVDLSDPDEKSTSFCSYIVSTVMNSLNMRKYLLTTGTNRTVFEIPYSWERNKGNDESL